MGKQWAGLTSTSLSKADVMRARLACVLMLQLCPFFNGLVYLLLLIFVRERDYLLPIRAN
jgi:hypothetical protein